MNENKRLFKGQVDNRLQRIANVLMLNASFIDNLGFLNGKVGISIFFYQYSRYTGNKVYTDYADELIDEIYEEININTPIDFANGLIGIGWGIEYLVREKYIDADRDEVLEEIDNDVHKYLASWPDSLKNRNNLFDFGLYCMVRLNHREMDNKIPITISNKLNIELVISKYMRFLVHNRYSYHHHDNLSVQTLIPILYFLNRAFQFRSCQAKIGKILTYLPEYVEFSLLGEVGFIDSFILAELLDRIAENVASPCLKKVYKDIKEKAKVFDENDNKESIISQFSRIPWYSLVFGIDFFNLEYKTLFFQKAFDIVDNESNWDSRLSMLNKNNIGLDNGLAGLGLVLTQYALYCKKK
jgi:lanthionine synthetase-like protein